MSHSRQTEHYGLPLYNGTDIINPLTDFNDANEAIDEAVYNANQRSVEAEESAQHSAETVTQYDARVTEAETIATNAGIKADNTQKMIAEDFDPLKEDGYKIGDSVIYNQHLYTFINPHSGAWDASDVKEQPISDALEDTIEQAKTDIQNELDDAIAQIDSQMVRVPATQAMIAPAFDPAKEGGYDAGKMVTYADKLYVFDTHHDGIWTGTDVTKADIADELSKIDAQIVKIPATQLMIAPAFNPEKEDGYKAKAVVTYADNLYAFTEDHVGAWTGTDVTQVDVEGQILLISDKLAGNVISSKEGLYISTVTGTNKQVFKDLFDHMKDLWQNKGDNVEDIIIDGIEVDEFNTLTCAWSCYNIFERGDTANGNFSYVGTDAHQLFSILYRAEGDFITFGSVLIANTGNTNSNLSDEPASQAMTINYHYLYKI